MSIAMPADLEDLKAEFDRHRSEWIAKGHAGEFVVLGSPEDVTFHATYEAAVAHAAETFGDRICLIQQLLREDRTETVRHVFW